MADTYVVYFSGKMGCKIYLPTVHLFAYSRGKKSNGSLEVTDNIDSDWLWQQCNQIIKTKLAYEFELKSFLRKENKKVSAENLINEELSKEELDFIHISLDKKIQSYDIDNYFPISIQQENDVKAEIYPLRLYDSYALGLNFYPPQQLNNKKFNIEEIKEYQLNADNCLFLPQENKNPFLGQTILITAKLTGKDRNKSSEWLKNNIADQYLEALFHQDTNFRKPAFNRAGKLFGRPVFEYGISRQLDNYIHVLIWLINDKDEKHIFERTYSKILDLFFFRTKVINAYKETRKHSEQAKRRNLRIEKKLEDMVGGSSSKKGLNNLHLTEIYDNLVELNKMSVIYANMLRDIEDHQNTIVNNSRNYSDKVREIKSIFPSESLGFLSFFGERTCRSFKDQVTAELGYFQHGIDLVDNVVDALRGQIAIEQTNRERELQSTILGLGFGMTAAGNWASSYEAGASAEGTEIPIPCTDLIIKLRFDISHFGVSLISSIIVGYVVWKAASQYFRNRYEEKQLVREKRIKPSRFTLGLRKRHESEKDN
jgi:hypothetical protein